LRVLLKLEEAKVETAVKAKEATDKQMALVVEENKLLKRKLLILENVVNEQTVAALVQKVEIALNDIVKIENSLYGSLRAVSPDLVVELNDSCVSQCHYLNNTEIDVTIINAHKIELFKQLKILPGVAKEKLNILYSEAFIVAAEKWLDLECRRLTVNGDLVIPVKKQERINMFWKR
jgi:hypothetical protein